MRKYSKKHFFSLYSSEEITNPVSKISINIAKTIDFLVACLNARTRHYNKFCKRSLIFLFTKWRGNEDEICEFERDCLNDLAFIQYYCSESSEHLQIVFYHQFLSSL